MPTHADQLKLLDLQSLDTAAQQAGHARKTHPTLARLEDLDARLADLDASLAESRITASDLKRDLTRAEDSVATVVARAEREQQRIDYGGLSHKDTLALSEDLAALGKRREILENEQLEVMERLEAHNDALAALEDAREELASERDAVEAERDAAFDEIDARRASLVAECRQIAAGIDPDLMKTYKQIRERKGGVAVAALDSGCCTGCSMELNPADIAELRAAPLDKVVRCEECGRILVRLKEL